jgi:membrane protease YdiL (CAAX protease family)
LRRNEEQGPFRVAPERGAWLVVVPLAATALYYVLPDAIRENPWIVFAPQIAAYVMLAIWLLQNRPWRERLWFESHRLFAALRWGTAVGLVMGAINLTSILVLIPLIGGDITFLRETPHALAPLWLMFPVGIAAIGIFVELNFRGFQMGRLLALFGSSRAAQAAAVIVSAFAFAWDPFMVNVFRSLHWIALVDGLIWGVLLLRTQSLYATMAAHTVEVWILYAGIKLWFR